jgi:hypothetical protein
MTYKAFVIKLGDKFCKFGSYSKCDLKDSPLKATIYSRKSDATRRVRDEHYVTGFGLVSPRNSNVDPISFPNRFRIVEITATFDEQEVK